MDETAAAPHDETGAMLAQQMAAVHAAAMRALERAADCTAHPQVEALYLRQAARLMHLFTRQMEARDRRRLAAEQRAKREERAAYFREKDRREEEARLFRLGLGPRPRRRPARPGGRGNGSAGARNGTSAPPDGPYVPDPPSG